MSTGTRKILLDVRRPEDAELARALVDAVGERFSFYLLFAEQSLIDRFGPVTHEHGLATRACMLNADAFCGLVGFGPPAQNSERAELLLVQLFNELELPTIKLQRALLEPGLFPLVSAAEQHTARALDERYAYKTVLSWGGPDGIGYLRSELPYPRDILVRDDLVHVTSNFDWAKNTDKECHQFAIAVVKLAMAHPEIIFVYTPRAEELTDTRGAAMVSMIEGYELENLRVETKEPALHVMARAGSAITMMSTAVLDLGRMAKPFLLFSAQSTDKLLDRPSDTSFTNYFELGARFHHLRAQPESCRRTFSLPRLDTERLATLLAETAKLEPLPNDWMNAAMRYYGLLCEGETLRPELNEIGAQLNQLTSRLSKLEKSNASVERTVAKIPERVSRVLERIGVLQRSTLAYKARKLWSRARDESGKQRR